MQTGFQSHDRWDIFSAILHFFCYGFHVVKVESMWFAQKPITSDSGETEKMKSQKMVKFWIIIPLIGLECKK